MTAWNETASWRDIIASQLTPPRLRPTAATPVLNRLPGIRAVLFDVYGTLLLSERNSPGPDGRPDDATTVKLRAFTEKYGIDREPAGLVNDFLVLIEKTNRAAAAAGVAVPEVNVIHIWHTLLGGGDYLTLKRLALEFEMIVHHCRPAGDLDGLFALLRSRGLALGIVSNAQFYTELILEYFLGKPLQESGFDKRIVLYSYIYRNAKPSEKLFQKAVARAARLGLRPDQVLFAGDSPENDIRPAERAGFRTALFCGSAGPAGTGTTARPAPELRPDVVLTDWKQIARII